MYNDNPFWKFRKKLSLGEAKGPRPSDSEKFGPPEEYRTRVGETRRSDLLSARKDELSKAKKQALAAVDSAKQEKDHGIPENISDIIQSGDSRKLYRHHNRLMKSKNPKLVKFAGHLARVADRTTKSPVHPEPQKYIEPD